MEEQEENKKVTLLDQLSIAVSSPKNYKQLVKLKTGRLVWFVVIISFLLAFIEFGIDAIFWVGKVGGLRNLITNKIPAFTYHDNKLDMEHDMQLEIGNATLYINTENASVNLDSMETDGVYIAIGSENIVMGMVSDGKGYDYMVTPLKYMQAGGTDTGILYVHGDHVHCGDGGIGGQTASPCADIQYSGQ